MQLLYIKFYFYLILFATVSFSVAQAGLESTILSALITNVSHQSPHPGLPYVFKNQFFPLMSTAQ